MRRMLVDICIGIIGITSYYFLLFISHWLFNIELDLTTTFFTTPVAMVMIVILIHKFGGIVSAKLVNNIHRQSYRQQLSEYANRIHNVFILREQGDKLLALVAKALNCKQAALLFPALGSEDFSAQLVEPKGDNALVHLVLHQRNPIVSYLKKESKPLTQQNLSALPGLHDLWGQAQEEIYANNVELFLPIISHNRLVSILVLGRKRSGHYSVEDLDMLSDVASRVAVSMEKEYLLEQLAEREQELAIINRSSAIITSSLDIRSIFDQFIEELKKVVDISWSAIVLVLENEARFLSLSSEVVSEWQVGQQIPLKDTLIELMVKQGSTVTIQDLISGKRFTMSQEYIKSGLRSIACLPLVVKSRIVGSLMVASVSSDAYTPRHVGLLEQLASQIAMPIENARLYARVAEMVRVDELTGLLNRRTFDEMITNEIKRHSDFGGVLSIIMFDLDNFKAYNDTYGHPAGDELLKWIGTLLKNSIKRTDHSFRFGGDEFAILLPQTPTEVAYEVAERIRKQIELEQKSRSVRITASLGLAGWPRDGKEPNEIIDAADAALYHAKRNGRNQSHLHRSE